MRANSCRAQGSFAGMSYKVYSMAGLIRFSGLIPIYMTGSALLADVHPDSAAAPEWLMSAVSRGTTAGCASSATRMSSTRSPWQPEMMCYQEPS